MCYKAIYNKEYYKSFNVVPYENADVWQVNFNYIADKIIGDINPRTVLDVGCAMGYLVAALRDRGVEAYGIDVSEYAISKVREDIQPYCSATSALMDLPDSFPKHYDLVVNIEVIEHLYEEDTDTFISRLIQYSDDIVFSSTPDDIHDKTHFNVQQPEYWAKRFAQYGFYKDLVNDVTFISPQCARFTKKEISNSKIVEDYERKMRLLSSINKKMEDESVEGENQNNILLEQINGLEIKVLELEASSEKIVSENESLALEIEAVQSELNEAIKQSENEKEYFKSQLADYSYLVAYERNEMNQLRIAYSSIINSTAWKMTKPIRITMDLFKTIVKMIVFNRVTKLLKNTYVHLKCFGLKQTLKKVRNRLRGQHDSSFLPPLSAQSHFRESNLAVEIHPITNNMIHAIPTIINQDPIKRLNLVTDSIEANSLLGGVATALVLATEFANKYDYELRIITRTSVANPVNYIGIMKTSNIEQARRVSFYSDCDGGNDFKLEICKEDIFIATSWWSAEAIRKTTLRRKFFYVIQEVETLFYPNGDEHLLCSQIMDCDDIDFIVNSHYLFEHFEKNSPKIAHNGVFFEPAFPGKLYKPAMHREKEKYKLFFYARPNHPRNLFRYGLKLIDTAISSGVLDTSKWDVYFAGQDLPELRFSNGYKAINKGLMSWDAYAEFLGGIDLSVSLMYTPHPSYPPFDVACSGGVVVTNSYDTKKDFNQCRNVILSELDQESFMMALSEGIGLATDNDRRKANFESSTIPRDWHQELIGTIEWMGEKIPNV